MSGDKIQSYTKPGEGVWQGAEIPPEMQRYSPPGMEYNPQLGRVGPRVVPPVYTILEETAELMSSKNDGIPPSSEAELFLSVTTVLWCYKK